MDLCLSVTGEELSRVLDAALNPKLKNGSGFGFLAAPKSGTKRKAETIEDKGEKKRRIDDTDRPDFRDKSGHHVKFSDISIKSADGDVFRFHRILITRSDMELLRGTIEMMPESRSSEVDLEGDSVTVANALEFISEGKEFIGRIDDIEQLCKLLRFADRYVSASLLAAAIDRICQLPLPWNWELIETTLAACKIPIDTLVERWMLLVASAAIGSPIATGNGLSVTLCKKCLGIPLNDMNISAIIRHVLPHCPDDSESRRLEEMHTLVTTFLKTVHKMAIQKPAKWPVRKQVWSALWETRECYWSQFVSNDLLGHFMNILK